MTRDAKLHRQTLERRIGRAPLCRVCGVGISTEFGNCRRGDKDTCSDCLDRQQSARAARLAAKVAAGDPQ